MAENQLLDAAEALPDLTEYDGMSIRDIALSVTLWDEGSEDQRRAIAAIQARAPGIGHNKPPLAERIDADFEASRRKGLELLAVGATVVVVDDESAGKVVSLVRLMSEFLADVDERRKELQKPYNDAIALIADRARLIADPVKIAREGEPALRGRGGLRGVLTAYDDKRQAEAEAARQRARDEQRERERVAEEARRRAEEAAAAGKSSVVAELAAAEAQEEADRAADRAEAIRPEPVRSHLGTMSRPRKAVFEIQDLRKVIGWLLRDPGRTKQIRASVETILDQHLRSLGIDTVARGVEIPGATVRIERGTANVRR